MDKEWRNILQRCSQPSFAVGLSLFFLREIAFRFRDGFKPRLARYPSAVRVVLKRMEKNCQPAVPTKRDETVGLLKDPAFLSGDSLRLAIGDFQFSEMPDWKVTFDDPEQSVSLHRWNWLLTRLTEAPFPEIQQWGLGLMRDWIAKVGDDMSGLPWESYTTGERICNSILFMTFSGSERNGLPDLPEDLTNGLRAMASFLAERLEYNGPEWTGNHVINNARALYFAGRALKDDSFTDLAASIFRTDLHRLVYSDGFLREGSSHYHFLVTRWLLEVLWIARLTGDRQVSDLIEPTARLMVERCWFFLVVRRETRDWVMPLIGDVSPDFSWQWLLDLPWSDIAKTVYVPEELPPRPKKRGWGSLFDRRENEEPALPGFLVTQDPKLRSFLESGWYRLDWGPISIFWHVEPTGMPSFASHGHCDIGSFCLYWNGVEIVTDPGRLNYIDDDPLGTYGASTRAHSSVLIDGFEAFVYKDRNRYPSFYLNAKVSVHFEKNPDSFKMFLQHTGFSRLHGDRIVYLRVFHISCDRLMIDDSIEGHSRRLIETSFQWAPGVEVTEEEAPGNFRIRTKACDFEASFSSKAVPGEEDPVKLNYELLRGEDAPTPGGWYFPGYGVKTEALTMRIKLEAPLPYARQYTLKWAN